MVLEDIAYSHMHTAVPIKLMFGNRKKRISFNRKKNVWLHIIACPAVIALPCIQVMLIISSLVLDFFEDECSENAAEKCSEFRPEVPLSEEFSSEAFDQYCG